MCEMLNLREDMLNYFILNDMSDEVLKTCNEYMKHANYSTDMARTLWLKAMTYFISLQDDEKAQNLVESALSSLTP